MEILECSGFAFVWSKWFINAILYIPIQSFCPLASCLLGELGIAFWSILVIGHYPIGFAGGLPCTGGMICCPPIRFRIEGGELDTCQHNLCVNSGLRQQSGIISHLIQFCWAIWPYLAQKDQMYECYTYLGSLVQVVPATAVMRWHPSLFSGCCHLGYELG